MKDDSNGKPVKITPAGEAGAFMIVRMTQTPAVSQLLDEHGVPYWMDQFFGSYHGEPPVIFFNFGPKVEPETVQCLLDAQP